MDPLDLGRQRSGTSLGGPSPSAVGDESRRAFAANPMSQIPFGDLGLSMSLETVAFEGFLSPVSDQIGDDLTSH